MKKSGKYLWQKWGLAATLALSVTAGVVSNSVTTAQGSIAYGLKAGKPYNGTKLKFLICCLGAGQFAQLSKLTGEGSEFQQLTGISAQWEDSPYGGLQEKILIQELNTSARNVKQIGLRRQTVKPIL